jgi:TM2 domain-containing membrane protein YozV
MNCTVHPESAATAYCRTCGKAMCDACKHTVHGVIYCEDCLATRVNQPAATMIPVGAPDAPSVGMATFLGFIPGVGAMYNGQFYKGLIHVAVFAGLIALQTTDIPGGLHAMLGIGIGFWYIYMIVDAHKTAKAKLYGLPLPDPFGIERMFGGSSSSTSSTPPAAAGNPYVAGQAPPPGFVPGQPVPPGYIPPPPPPAREPSPVGAIVLIGLGVLFLLNQMGWWNFHWLGRMWPLILIGLGVWLFIRRFNAGQTSPGQQ